MEGEFERERGRSRYDMVLRCDWMEDTYFYCARGVMLVIMYDIQMTSICV